MDFKGLHFFVLLLCFVTITSALPCQPVQCFMNPCENAACPAFANGAVCSTDYCNGCNAKWTMDGVDVTETCLKGSQSAASVPTSGATAVQTAPIMQKPILPKLPGTEVFVPPQLGGLPDTPEDPSRPCSRMRMRCFINPCDRASCPAFASQAVCSPDYCNGCVASWKMDGNDVTETCVKSAIAARIRSQLAGASFLDSGAKPALSDNAVPLKEETRGVENKSFRNRQRFLSNTLPSWMTSWGNGRNLRNRFSRFFS